MRVRVAATVRSNAIIYQYGGGSLKVVAIDTFVCDVYRTNWVFVRVQTDAGLYGIGESTLEMREQTTIQAIDELGRILIGRDPHDIEAFRHDAYRDAYWRGGPVLMSALAGVEMALWDIKGKDLGVPVYQLLGGRIRDLIPCYANGWFAPAKTPEEFAEKARNAVAAGFSGLKWDPFGKSYMTISRSELNDALSCVQAVSDAVGDTAEILIEGHGRFDVPSAIRIGHALEDFDIFWFEEPIPPDNLEALLEVKRRTRVPIAAGERLYTRREYATFFEMHCADFAQPDVSHAGGIQEMRQIASMAETAYIPFCPHNPSGPVANAATLQLAACIPNFVFVETMTLDVPWRSDITNETLQFRDGGFIIPDLPGLGIDINVEAILDHPYTPHDLRHYSGKLTDIRPPESRPYFAIE